MSFTSTFQVLLIMELLCVTVMWLWTLTLLFTRRKHNVGRASFITPASMCIICEMARTIDPFTRWGIWSNRSLRIWLTIEVWIMLSLLLLACDIAAWLNYYSVPSLLLKPQRRYRHSLYIGICLMFIQGMILLGMDLLSAEVSRGMIIGWIFSALILMLIGMYTMLVSIREVHRSLELRSRTAPKVGDTIFCADEEEDIHGDIKTKDRSTCFSKCRSYLTCAFIFEKEENYENSGHQKRIKYMKKSWRLCKYMICLACLLIFDVSLGVNPTPGEMDLIHLVYDLVLKIILVFMIFQRRPIPEPRDYEKVIHEGYKPFNETLFSGSKELHTYHELQLKVSEATKRMGLKDNHNSIQNLTVQEKSRNDGYYRAASYDDDSVANLPLEGDIRGKLEITAPFAPVKPPKEVSSMHDSRARGFSLPALGDAVAAGDAQISTGVSLQVPNKGTIVPPMRVGSDDIGIESGNSSLEDPSIELVKKYQINPQKQMII